jgi:hypothetical protein
MDRDLLGKLRVLRPFTLDFFGIEGIPIFPGQLANFEEKRSERTFEIDSLPCKYRYSFNPENEDARGRDRIWVESSRNARSERVKFDFLRSAILTDINIGKSIAQCQR